MKNRPKSSDEFKQPMLFRSRHSENAEDFVASIRKMYGMKTIVTFDVEVSFTDRHITAYHPTTLSGFADSVKGLAKKNGGRAIRRRLITKQKQAS